MTDKQIIIDGCEFQSDCIEYKDISYLKIMPICAIHELSIACHDKVNKCKYYKLYKQLKAKEQECEYWKHQAELGVDTTNRLTKELEEAEEECERLKNELLTYGATGICETCTNKSVLQNDKYTKALREIKEIIEQGVKIHDDIIVSKQILQKCEVLNDR